MSNPTVGLVRTGQSRMGGTLGSRVGFRVLALQAVFWGVILPLVILSEGQTWAQAEPDEFTAPGGEDGQVRWDDWYWGLAASFDVAFPLGDEQFALAPGYQEFLPVLGFGIDLLVDITRYLEAGVAFRYGFGGLDTELFADPEAFPEQFDVDLSDLSSSLWQLGLRLRCFPLDTGALRPFLGFDLLTTTLWLQKSASEDTCNADGCVAESETLFSYLYRGISFVPGLGVRWDVPQGGNGGGTANSDLLTFLLQASYAVNSWSDTSVEAVGQEISTPDVGGLHLDHLWITLGLGYLF